MADTAKETIVSLLNDAFNQQQIHVMQPLILGLGLGKQFFVVAHVSRKAIISKICTSPFNSMQLNTDSNAASAIRQSVATAWGSQGVLLNAVTHHASEARRPPVSAIHVKSAHKSLDSQSRARE